MSFTTTEITKYSEKATEMLAKSVLFSEDWKNYKRVPIVGETKTLKFKATSQILQSGKCIIPVSGGTAFTEKTVTSFIFGSNVEYCTDNLFGYGMENFSMEKEVFQGGAEDEKVQLDELFWNGSVAGGDLYDGLLIQISGDTEVVNANYTTTISNTTIDDAIQAIWEATSPSVRKKGLVLHVSYNTLDIMRDHLSKSPSYMMTIQNVDDAANDNKLKIPFYSGKLIMQAEPTFPDGQIVATHDDNILIIEPSAFKTSNMRIVPNYQIPTVFNVISQFGLGWDYAQGSEITILKAL